MAKTIIFADDSVTMRKVGEITFAGDAYELVALAGGSDVVDAARKQKPAVIILDTVMPDLDGYEACKAVRSDPELGGVPVLLMAGPSSPIDEGRARDAGASGHINKPFETQAMLDKVESLTGKPAAAPAPEVAAKPAAPPRAQPRTPAGARTVIGLGALGHAPPGVPGGPPAGPPAAVPPRTPPKLAPAAKPAPSGPLPLRPAGAPAGAAAARPAAAPQARPAPQAKPAPQPAAAPAAEPAAPAAPVRAKTHEMSPEEVRMIEGIAREVIERVVWEVVPELAETIIREELAKLLKE